MTNLKVLDLEGWMMRYDLFDMGEYKSIKPIYNRNGYYLYGKACWFEIDGKAYEAHKEDFVYSLELKNHIPFRGCTVDALITLIKEGMINNIDSHKFYIDRMYKELNDTKRRVKLFMLKHRS